MSFETNLTPSRRNFDALLNEYHITKQQLDSKIQAFKILNRELDLCKNERDQLKVVLEQLRLDETTCNGQSLKDLATNGLFPDSWKLKGQCDQLIVQRLCQVKDKNRLLQNEVRDLKCKLDEADGDLKTVRETVARQRHKSVSDFENSSQGSRFSLEEREILVKQLETIKNKYILLEKDLQSVLDEKEELVKERDSYKNKVDRLNLELNVALKGDEKKIIDVDSILMENRYLQERLKQTQEEKSLYLQTLSKYRNILEKRRNRSALKLGGKGSGSVIITHKQVEHMLQNSNITQLPVTQATVADLRSLSLALFESLNDKNIALSHQKKTNKTLGLRLSELENKISSLKLSGSLNLEVDFENMPDANFTVDNSSLSDCLQMESPHHNNDIDPVTAIEKDDEIGQLQLDKEISNDIECNGITSHDSIVVIKENASKAAIGAGESLQRKSIFFVSDFSSFDFDENDDLPPDLQKLVQLAIEDIDKKMVKSLNNGDEFQ